MTIYGIDFGTGDALAIHGPNGSVSKRELKLSRVKGGRTPALEFVMVAEALMALDGDIVTESATIGASGCELQDVLELLRNYPDRILYTISCRAVKNFRKDNNLDWKKGARYAKDGDEPPVEMTLEEQAAVHVEDAEIIYRIATEHPERLYRWTGPSDPAGRCHTSVRPMDKRGYRDDRAEGFMRLLPPYDSLPGELQDILGNGRDYSRSVVMPFAMASTEPFLDNGPREDRRRRYEKIIGLYDRGYPSFYRRATINWMQINAKLLAGVTKIEDVDCVVEFDDEGTPIAKHNDPVHPLRKEAWRITQRQVRQFFHLTMAHQGR